jgi:predicted membrane protein
MVLGAILVVSGGIWLLDALDAFSIRASIVLPAVLAVVGLALIVGSFDGPHNGLVVFGVFLTIAVVASAVVPSGAFDGGIGQRDYVVTNQTDLVSNYDVAIGDLTLDLSDLTLTHSATIEVAVGTGQMRIQLPPDVPVSIDAAVEAGQVDLLGETADGLSVSRTYTSPGFADAAVRLTLDLNVVAGQIEVRQ